MANRLSSRKVEELWATYQELQSDHKVAAKCGCHHRTVRRYRVQQGWDQRLAAIREQAQHEADYDLAKAMSEHLKLVRSYKAKLATALEGKTVSADTVTASELERVAKLEAYLLGGVESRHEIVSRFDTWTEEELERYAKTGKRPARTGSSPA